MRGETWINWSIRSTGSRFQSTPLMRGETILRLYRLRYWLFQSTPLMRGETGCGCGKSPIFAAFQSTPLMRGETCRADEGSKHFEISIHSPRARGDDIPLVGAHVQGISIHSPRARGDASSAREVRGTNISIHSPRARGDRDQQQHHRLLAISIHSPRARGDKSSVLSCLLIQDFNPLPSCEGRRFDQINQILRPIFQSTPLMRGETRPRCASSYRLRNFNPLPSCEGRLAYNANWSSYTLISIHSPHARGDEQPV